MEKSIKRDIKNEEESAELIKKGIEKKQNEQLKKILIIIVIVLAIIGVWVMVLNSIREFEYKSTGYTVVKEGKLIFYQTTFPFYSSTGKHVSDYNIYLRNDPRKLKDISFEGEMNIKSNMVINLTNEFNCNGDGTIAIANLAQSLNSLGTKVIKDSNASCDSQGRYCFLQIGEGNETRIDQFGSSCYKISVNDCEILKGTEKFMIEYFYKLNENK